MPGTMTENENRLSLLSIEVLISQVQIDLNVECHLPCIVFRLLDYPAVSIPYFDQWEIGEFHNLKRDNPNVPWRQLLSDQFYELRSANGKFNFKRGKSCLFKTYFQTLYGHLLNVPLFILLTDQIHEKNENSATTHFIGSCNVKLNELAEMLNQSIIQNGYDIPLVEQQTFHCKLFNLMGTPIGNCDIAVRFTHYGTTILTQLPSLDEQPKAKTEAKIPAEVKQNIKEPTVQQHSDAIVKHIHFVNEKKDVALQISRSEIQTSTGQNKSAQTRWTSTKSYHSKGRHPRIIDEPTFDDTSITFYQPPPLYFNSESDFLHMMTPQNMKHNEEAKENRLSYLASIPIDNFAEDFDLNDENHDNGNIEHHRNKLRQTKSGRNVRFNLSPASSVTTVKSDTQTRLTSQQAVLTKDFLHDFPLLRALVEEALSLQQQHHGTPMSIRQVLFDGMPKSSKQPQMHLKQTFLRPKSATNNRSVGTKSVIVPRKVNNTRRLYPPPPSTRQMIVTRNDVRNLVDRLSKPKPNIRLEQQINIIDQMAAQEENNTTPRSSRRPTSAPTTVSKKNVISQKPPLSYGTTRAHRLYTEFSQARRAAHENQRSTSPKPKISPRKVSPVNGRNIIPSPQLLNTGTLSNFSMLNKVDVDSATTEKKNLQPSLLTITKQTTNSMTKSSTTSQDVTLNLNHASSESSDSLSITPQPTLPDHNRLDMAKNDLGFSITDITDYFTDGGNGSSTRPSTRQST